MGRYKKRPVIVEAVQWFREGDHPKVCTNLRGYDVSCSTCYRFMSVHGTIKTLEGVHTVCPKDWIITGIQGEHYPCKPDIFEQTYEKVEGETEDAL